MIGFTALNCSEVSVREVELFRKANFEGSDTISSHLEVINQVFCQCKSQEDLSDLLALSHVNKYHYVLITQYLESRLQELSSELVILHLHAIELCSPFAVFKCCKEMSPHVENQEGVSLFIDEGLTMDELADYSQSQNVRLEASEEILQADRKLSKEPPRIVIATNGVFVGSRSMTHKEQEMLVFQHHCEMLSARTTLYLILCLLIISQKEVCIYGREPLTFTRTSTFGGEPDASALENNFLSVGGSSPRGVRIRCHNLNCGFFGAGGQRTLAYRCQTLSLPLNFPRSYDGRIRLKKGAM